MKAETLIKELKRHNIRLYIEVPCSILSPLISRLLKDRACTIMNPVNEAVAVGLAAGGYLTNQGIPAILIQNSGFCNTLNGLTSLNQIYRIPFLYIISWRGEPGKKDAPEHYLIGKKMKRLLELMDVCYEVLSEKGFKEEIGKVMAAIRKTSKPAAILLREGLLEEEDEIDAGGVSLMAKSAAVDIIVSAAYNKAYFIATNGYISREVFYNLNKNNLGEENTPFYMLGSMGHASAIGLGIARFANKDKKVVVLDGDGGCLMHLGSMASVTEDRRHRLIHIVLDNASYASTGGQPTLSSSVNLCQIAKGCGYKNIYRINNEPNLQRIFPSILKKGGPTFVHILISNCEGKERPRISQTYTCEDIKDRFIDVIRRKQ